MLLVGASGFAFFGALGAHADDDFGGLTLSANTAIVSDYRFRGISLSDRDAAIQGGMDLSHESGFYIGTWGSSIESFAGSEFELDLYAGYSSEFNGLATDIGVLVYTYPGSDDTHYVELYSSVGGEFEKLGWTIGAAYVWDQENVGSRDNIYLYLDLALPIADTPFSISGHLAFEDGAFGDKKWDWNAGLAYQFKQFSLSVSYVDTNVDGRLGGSGVVAMLSASF
ncbi:MAG: hypothetical protein COB37_10905 [Kordiimonadales bacterium]|nr:MAG: hypothetical protein COB37_10905 [Kordiimonadales bacterium]